MQFDRHLPKLAYSIKEACQASSLGKTTIYAHISAGHLRAVRIGGRTVIPAESLRALINGEVCKAAANTQ
jgi:excisionase family DNA binding protein